MHTRSTLNYQLPQFDSSDKPTWLGDINGAFLAIDSAMHENATNAGEAKTAATSALAALNNALERAQAADTKATQAVATANTASATATEALTTATAAANLADTTAEKLAAARLRHVWHNSDATQEQTPGTVTLANYTANNTVFVFSFVDANDNVKNVLTLYQNGEGTAKGQKVGIDLVTGAIGQYWREIGVAQSSDDVTITIGACNVISSDGSSASASVDNTQLVLNEIYIMELPTL